MKKTAQLSKNQMDFSRGILKIEGESPSLRPLENKKFPISKKILGILASSGTPIENIFIPLILNN